MFIKEEEWQECNGHEVVMAGVEEIEEFFALSSMEKPPWKEREESRSIRVITGRYSLVFSSP